jgi:hypothetical protein
LTDNDKTQYKHLSFQCDPDDFSFEILCGYTILCFPIHLQLYPVIKHFEKKDIESLSSADNAFIYRNNNKIKNAIYRNISPQS